MNEFGPRRTACARITTRLQEFEHSEPFRTRAADAQSHGTCFAVRMCGQTMLLTNAHCVIEGNGACALSMEHAGGPTQLPATVRLVIPELDVAIIDCPSGAALEPLNALLEPFSCDERRDALAKGLVVQGFPLGDGSGVRTTFGCYAGTTSHQLQMSMAVNKGNSGGPVTLRSDPTQVIGIATASFQGTESMSLAIPLYHVAAALKHARPGERLLRVPHLHRLRVAPVDGGVAQPGARVLENWGQLQAEDVITSVCGMELTDTGLLRIPHNFSGAELDSVEVALALPHDTPARAKVRRAGVTGAIDVHLSLKLPQAPAAVYPLWENPGGLHYVMFEEMVAIVPKSEKLLDEFDVLPDDEFWVAAAAAKPGTSIVAWVAPMSAAERIGIEPLMLIEAIDDRPAADAEGLEAAVAAIPAARRQVRRPKNVAFKIAGGHKYRLPVSTGFTVHHY